jgi:hypothetical protein|tara:strand:- start:71815 stop:72231 length:417 start_codon:yes stop_codon:yes gene_type:complete
MTKNSKGVQEQLSEIFNADKTALTRFFNEVVAYGMDVVLTSCLESKITLGAVQQLSIRQAFEAECPKAFDRFARDFKAADINSAADFEAYYEYPVSLRYQQECAIQKDLLARGYNEETAVLGQLALESIYQVTKLKLN